MSQNPNPSLLDPGQIIKRAFDGTEDRLRVDAEVTATIVGPQEVIISDTDDSIKIGNGSGTYAQVTGSNALKVDGSAVTQPVSFAGGVTVNNGAGVSAVNIQDGGNSITVDGTVSISGSVAVTGPLTDTQLRASPVPISGTVTITDGSGPVTVDGTVAATQSGTWNINNVSGTVSLPTGAATSAKQDTGNTSLSSIDTKLTNSQSQVFGPSAGVLNLVLFELDMADWGGVYISLDATTTSGIGADNTEMLIEYRNNTSDAWGQDVGLRQQDSTILGPILYLDVGNSHTAAAYGTLIWYTKARYVRGRISLYQNTLGNSSYTARIVQVKEVPGIVTPRGQSLGSDSIPVVIASDQSDVPISATSLPLPTGAATAALQTQPGVDIGDVTINNASGAAAVNIQDGGNSITVDGSVTVSGTVAATQSGTWTVRNQDGSGNSLSSTGNALDVNLKTSSITLPISATSLPLPTLAATSTKQSDGSQKTQIVDGSGNVISSTSNALNVSATQSGTWNITNVSGTVSLPTGAATESTLAKLAQTQGSTTSTQSGPLIQGAVTTSAPSYSTGQTDPLSLNTSGGLRVDGSGVTQPISAASLPLPSGAATDTSVTNVQGSVTGGTVATKSSLAGGIFNQPVPFLTPGNQVALQTDANGNLLVTNVNLNIHTELLQELILETRAMRMALVALVTEGQRVRADDFNPQENDYSSTGYIN